MDLRSYNYIVTSNGFLIHGIYRANTLVGMAMVNDIEQGRVLLSLIQNRISVKIDKKRLRSPGFNYKQLI